MRLYDRAVNIGVRLDAAAVADASDALLAQGQSLVGDLDLTSSRLESAVSMRVALNVGTRPTLNEKVVAQAIGAFRAGFSRRGAAVFQHAQASTLRDVAKQQRAATERWVLSAWRARFDELTPHIALATDDNMQGNVAQRQRAESRLRMLKRIRDLNPLVDAAKLKADLGGDDLTAWLDAVTTLDKEFHVVLETLTAARALQSSTVRAALARASSPEGLPLDELTDELRAELRAVGVEDQLVVRHV